jgi:hypothetical protein
MAKLCRNIAVFLVSTLFAEPGLSRSICRLDGAFCELPEC